MNFITKSHNETFQLGEKIGKLAQPGNIIALKGDLGAGKTVLTKGIASALSIKEDVTSPTYNIVCEYTGSIPLYHMDLYRISDIEEFEMLGVDNLLFGKGLSVIEWSERIEGNLPEDIITITILRNSNDESRDISIIGMIL
ncbi:MAG: tRNA (adenosine(37)-N6)-threonylcarbamoyltransferase complex ATPase subunit type 1 TsaE [Spirochaetaceae bacterium 4572_7]|nr:MAG: tRNA (adenosine(37)-N6)-threonylcarbamoyltransferase complex ATPase subunit type 1 TsaE [Spirochaetaceae bacterium 4572_7]